MKIMVTGASGFVGKHLLNVLLKNNVSVIAICHSTHLESGTKTNLRVVECKLDDSKKMMDVIPDRDIDCCIHLAWQGANGSERGNSDIQIKNIQRTLTLCETLAKMNVKRFVGIGTLAEKDTSNYIPTDGATPNLISYYGVAKMTTQYMSKILCTKLGIEHVWCQLSNLYGVGDKTNNFINFASKLMLKGERASFTPGEQMYDFVYVTDVAQAIYLAALNGRKNTTYYVGSGNQRKLKYFIQDIRNAIDPSIEIHLGEIPYNGVCLPDEEFDCSKLQNDTGYKAQMSFDVGIKKTVDWLKIEMETSDGKN